MLSLIKSSPSAEGFGVSKYSAPVVFSHPLHPRLMGAGGVFADSKIKTALVGMLLHIWLFLERRGLCLVEIPKIEPSERTQRAFALLRKIYGEAERRDIKVWLTGSWAITGRNGGFFKNIEDIDFTMRKRKEEKQFASLLEDIGLVRREDSPLGATRYLDSASGTEVDFGSTTYPGTIYYRMPLDEKEAVELEGFRFKVIR